jgi:hypothetical protein
MAISRQLAFDMLPRLRPIGAQTDKRLQPWLVVGSHENPFHYCIACVAESIEAFDDPVRHHVLHDQQGIASRRSHSNWGGQSPQAKANDA